MYRSVLIGALALVAAAGCSSMDASSMAGGEFGATQGGVQDMKLARELVEQGNVPPPEAFMVEAMFSEHDLPVTGAACDTTLCLRSAMGIAPSEAGELAAWVQVGMSSTIDPATYKRPSLAVVATVDISSSMQWTYGDGGGSAPAAIAHTLLHNVASRLDGNDRFAMVSYGDDVTEELEWTDGDEQEDIKEAIGSLDEGGSTNMEAGLGLAYELAEDGLGSASEVRVMVFTDAQPNVGATSGSQFESMVKAAADKGIGTTVVGLGMGLGADLSNRMSHLRGGNVFSLQHADDVSLFMQDNWPWLVCPIAHDLELTVTPSGGYDLARSFGFPSGDAGAGVAQAHLSVASVFLSKRKGALLVELSPKSVEELEGDVTVQLSYHDRSGETVEQVLDASYTGQQPDELGVYMPQPGIRKAVALAQLTASMHQAAEDYGNDRDAAVALVEDALERFSQEAAVLGDAEMDAEAAFWPKLLQLMESGAQQGDMYGHGGGY